MQGAAPKTSQTSSGSTSKGLPQRHPQGERKQCFPRELPKDIPKETFRRLPQREALQRDVEIIHVIAKHLTDKSDALLRLAPDGMAPAMAHADEVKKPIAAESRKHPRNIRIIPKSRDFH